MSVVTADSTSHLYINADVRLTNAATGCKAPLSPHLLAGLVLPHFLLSQQQLVLIVVEDKKDLGLNVCN
jgi:hypothetical protein